MSLGEVELLVPILCVKTKRRASSIKEGFPNNPPVPPPTPKARYCHSRSALPLNASVRGFERESISNTLDASLKVSIGDKNIRT